MKIRVFAGLILTSLLTVSATAQSPSSLPGPIVVCPAGDFDGHHHVPIPADILNRIQQNQISKSSSTGCATIEVTYTGFTPAAQTAFQYAVDIWENAIGSDVTIVVEAEWSSLGSGVLGSAGPASVFKDFTNAPDDRYYASALADHMAGFNLNPGEPDIVSNFNSTTNWYLGTDGNAPFNQYDLVSVVLHELGHGLGFISSRNYENGIGEFGLGSPPVPMSYDDHLVLGLNGSPLLNLSTGTTLGNAFTSNNVYCNSAAATTANAGTQPRIYAPASYAGGSSISHWNEGTYPAGNTQSLMTPQIGAGEAIHNPGTMTLGLFEDMGWTLCESAGGDDPCTTWTDPTPTTGWTNFNTAFGGAPCDDGTGCPFNEISAFEVWASEAYTVNNFIEGGTYTFSICNGPGTGSWVPEFTIIAPGGTVDAFGPGTGCAITWTASESGTYTIVINQAGSCGTANTVDNGFPALTCTDGTAMCDPDTDCITGNLLLTGSPTICGDDTRLVNTASPPVIPAGGGFGINFFSPSLNTGFNRTGVTLPYTFDHDLNGLLSANDIDLLSGIWELTPIVYSNPASVATSICSTGDAMELNFLDAGDPACGADPEPCTDWSQPEPGAGWIDFNDTFGGAPCDDGTGCPFHEIQGFQVWAGEAYEVDNFQQGGTYTFSMCNGPGAGSWIPEFTIIAPSGEVDAFGGGENACSITWTASEDGTYIIVVNEMGSCGAENTISNGYPALTCTNGSADCTGEEPCSTEPLLLIGSSDVCPGNTATVDLLASAQIPTGGGYAINFFNPTLNDGFNLTGVSIPYTFDNDLNGVLSANDLDPLSGTWELTGFVYTDPADAGNSACATAISAIAVNFLDASDPACLEDLEPCISWQDPSPTTAWSNFNNEFGGAPCDDGSGCPFNEIQDIEVWAGEAYALDDVLEGGTYTFSMCNGAGAGSWTPNFTIIAPGGAVDAFGPGTGCAITWTASTSGTYFIVINELGNCGGANTINNGLPAISCEDGTAMCEEEETCATGTLNVTGETEICPETTTTVALSVPATIPAGGGYAINFFNSATNSGFNLTNVQLPYTFDNDLNGVLSANDLDPLEGEWELTGLVYSDPANVAGSICATAANAAVVDFLSENDPLCSPEPDCETGNLLLTGSAIVCPDETRTVNVSFPSTIPSGGGMAIRFHNPATNMTVYSTSVSLPYTFDNDLNGMLSAGSLPPLFGIWELTPMVYTDLFDLANNICFEGPNDLILNYVSADDAACTVNVNDHALIHEWTIYPNPAHDITTLDISLKTSAILQLQIVDLTGRTVHREQLPLFSGERQFSIQTGHLAPGIYGILLYGNGERTVKQLIIQH